MSVMLDHITGKDNLIPDYLSRRRIGEAIGLIRARRGIDPVRIELGAWWEEWPKRLMLQTMKYAEEKWDAEALKEFIALDGQVEEVVEEAAGDPSVE